MASEVDICNLALSRLGDNATVASINPPEGSAQGEHCARFYPIARDSLLESHPWKFATCREPLARLSHESWNWAYAYAAPVKAIRLLSILPATASNDARTQDYEMEADNNGVMLILTNVEQATVRYIARVTDPTKYSPLFVDALGWLLASHLAGPIIKGDAGAAMARSCYQSFQVVNSQALVSDSNQQQITPAHMPDWMADRGAILPGNPGWGR